MAVQSTVQGAATEESGRRRLAVGAEPAPTGGVAYRVWAPRRRQVEVVTGEVEVGRPCRGAPAVELRSEGNGYYSGSVPAATVGTRYLYRLDGEACFPDPAARFQPDGPHGPSEVVDPSAFVWTDRDWRGVGLLGQVIYELHVGTFTREGSWPAAARELPELAAAGLTVIELMPVADFPGRFGWGYDGVNLFAPTRLYGRPDDFRRFVDRAHAVGLGVILDVVYNHLGPDGNYIGQFAAEYSTDRYVNEWGDALNFDGPGSGPVREFFVSNAGYWIDEYHLDGLRLDATQQIFDSSPRHVLVDIAQRVRESARARGTILVAENESQRAKLVRSIEGGGYGLDALWNDDLHHSALVALTGHNEAYYGDYLGTPQELISALKWGYLYQGQRSAWQEQRRGTPAFGLSPAAFVSFIQNHDQVANSFSGRRVHQATSPGRYRAMLALVLLAPATPMLFQGQEFAASSPFFYFADQNPDLAKLVRAGRTDFLEQFPSMRSETVASMRSDPADPATFERSKLDLGEREKHAEAYALTKDLLRLRREDPVFSAQRPGALDGAVLGPEAFVLRFFAEDSSTPQRSGSGSGQAEDRLLVVNLGRDLRVVPAPEPLLAPPEDRRWALAWSSEEPRYGGQGATHPEITDGWHLAGHAAAVLVPVPREVAGDAQPH